MSAQTGVVPPSGPASQRLVDRARFRAAHWKSEPNPIWLRELKQAARLTRTPAILSIVAILTTLLMASIGGIVLTFNVPPATTGMVLFHVFFSLAYFVVTLLGPAVAANSIASEREGRTWEAVLLTGLRPSVIARGKFLAAYTSIAMYIFMLAPIGAVAFLFGGITAFEVIAAFVLLFVIALLSVAFGLAISSKMSSLRTAIVVTLLLAFPASLTTFGILGVALAVAAADVWPGIPAGAPVWLPIAYARAPFGLAYFVYLVLLPVALVIVPAWFLYEVTIANLTSITDDRSTGIKRWFLAAVPTVTVAVVVPLLADPSSITQVYELGAGGVLLFLTYAVFLFQGDPIGPSRRVAVHWDQIGAGAFRRFLGPGVMRSAALVLACGVASLAAFTATAYVIVRLGASSGAAEKARAIASFGGYAIGFLMFLIGLGAWMRSRCTSPATARLITFGVLFGVCVGPWVLAAIAGVIADPASASEAMIVAAPSPFYPILMASILEHGGQMSLVIAGMVSAVVWMVTGLFFVAVAGRKCKRIIEAHERALSEADRRLAEEDARRA